MKRRSFLKLGTLLGLSGYLHAEADNPFTKEYKAVAPVIEAVLEHMFPSGSKIPSAREVHLVRFVYETLSHPSYDRDIRRFVVEGARELEKRTGGRFVMMKHHARERALREYEQTGYGDNWLGRMMTLGMEGLFSDPLYGANKAEAGWRALDAYGGQPRPTVRYLGI
jgi:hypothetical protein